MSWEEIQLGNVLELKRGYDLPARLRMTGKIPIISSSGITGTHSEAKVEGPGVVTGRYGTIGEVFYIEKNFWPLNTTLYVRNFKGNDPKYISYFLKGFNFSAFSGKSAVPGLNRNHLHQEYVRVAPKDEQPRIVEIVSSLDEKIELNRKQNCTLEAIAQTLFKRWFVEFEFPDENGQPYKSSGGAMQPSVLGEIPVGWGVGTIGNFVAHKKEPVTPGNQPKASFYHYSIPNFDNGQEPKSELGESILSNKYLVMSGSILVSKLNPRIPRTWPVIDALGELSVCSTEFQVFVPNEKAYGFVLNLLKFPYVESEMVTRASGTSGSHQRINPDDLLSIEVVHPDEELTERFHCAVIEGVRKVQFNLDQNNVLAQLRDTLLPKLMSGELRVGTKPGIAT